jgi:hypothetical protein
MDKNRVTARVAQLYLREDVTHIKLEIPAGSGPKEDIFSLWMSEPNYNALFALTLAAAANRWPLQIRVKGDDPTQWNEGNVRYLVVNWTTSGDD